MSSQRTSRDSLNVISSQESESGVTLSGSQAGPMTDQSGQAPVPASHSRRRGKGKVLTTPDTFGLSGSGSSRSIALSQSLASKLQVLYHGSTLFRETWKVKVTPSGRQFWAHTASVRRISGSGFTGQEPWSTPRSNKRGFPDAHGSHEAPWPTPQSHDERERGNTNADHHHQPHDLSNMASWASPMGRDMRSEWGSKEMMERRQKRPQGKPLSKQAIGVLSNWVSPTAQDHSRGTRPPRPTDTGIPLSQQVSGLTVPGSPASTESPGQLNPAHSRWLMGLPREWDDCGATVTRSSRSKRKCS